jgi:hypothetical protein
MGAQCTTKKDEMQKFVCFVPGKETEERKRKRRQRRKERKRERHYQNVMLFPNAERDENSCFYSV